MPLHPLGHQSTIAVSRSWGDSALAASQDSLRRTLEKLLSSLHVRTDFGVVASGVFPGANLNKNAKINKTNNLNKNTNFNLNPFALNDPVARRRRPHRPRPRVLRPAAVPKFGSRGCCSHRAARRQVRPSASASRA